MFSSLCRNTRRAGWSRSGFTARSAGASPRPGQVGRTSASMVLWSVARRSHLLRRLSERSKCSESTRGHHACTAVARAAMPLRARLDSACAVALAVDRRYRTMNSELWQLIPDRWLLSHLHAAPSSTTRHRQGEWSRAERISGGRPCVGRLSDRTTRSSAPLHAERRAEGALPLPVGARKKSVTV